MFKTLLLTGLVLLASGSAALADRGDRYRGSDRGSRYSSHGGWSIGFGFSNDSYRGDSSYFDIGYSSRGYRSYDNFCSTPRVYSPSYSYSYRTYEPRQVIVREPVYVAPAPVYVAPPPVYYEPAPVYYPGYPSTSFYRYDSCTPCGTYYRTSTRFYYGR